MSLNREDAAKLQLVRNHSPDSPGFFKALNVIDICRVVPGNSK